MSRLRCNIGIHDYEPRYEERRVLCRYCGDRCHDMEILLIERERRAWEHVDSGRWDIATAEDYVEEIWNDD